MKASNHEMFIKQRQKELFDEIKKWNLVRKQNEMYAEPTIESEPEAEIVVTKLPESNNEQNVKEPESVKTTSTKKKETKPAEETKKEEAPKKKGRKKKSKDAKE